MPGLPILPGREVAIEDRVDLVGSRRGLVDALAVDRDHALRAREQVEERRRDRQREISVASAAASTTEAARLGQRGVEADRVLADVACVDATAFGEMGEQAGEQRDVGARRELRCKSAISVVAVARGSMTTTFVPRASRAATSRWNSTGWHQARLEPTSTTRSASSMSS